MRRYPGSQLRISPRLTLLRSIAMSHPDTAPSAPQGAEETSPDQPASLTDDALEGVAGGGVFLDMLNQIRPIATPLIGGGTTDKH